MKANPRFRSRSKCVIVIFLALVCFTIGAISADPTPKGKLTHVGLVWLKNPGDHADRQRVIEAAHRFAREIPEVQSLSVGQPHRSASALVDSSFDICLTMQFEDQAALDRYARHPVHEKAAQEVFLPLSRKILFYDFITE